MQSVMQWNSWSNTYRPQSDPVMDEQYDYDSDSSYIDTKNDCVVKTGISAKVVDSGDNNSTAFQSNSGISKDELYNVPVYSIDVAQKAAASNATKPSLWNRLLSCFFNWNKSETEAEKTRKSLSLRTTTGTTKDESAPLLAPKPAGEFKKTLVLDLDETLVHTSFTPISDPDFVLEVEMGNTMAHAYVKKRPGVDAFLRAVGEMYEVVIFTASLTQYADAVIDALDTSKVVSKRLCRNDCVFDRGIFVKDLSQLGRPLKDVAIIDNSPWSYILHPRNAIPILTWLSDDNDTALSDLMPLLCDMAKVDDVCVLLKERGVSPAF